MRWASRFCPREGVEVRVTRNEDPRKAKQFVTVEKGIPWETEVTESCTYWLVAQNGQSEFSNVIQVNFTNVDEGYKLIHETAMKLDEADREYRFRNPVDRNALVVLLKDIIAHLKNDKRIPPGEIRSAFDQAVADQLVDDAG